MHRVFVYGTLKSGHYNHRCISMDKTSKMVEEESFIVGQMFDLGAFPAVTPGHMPIKGEVWEVSDETLARLDHLEGHPDFYVRMEVPLMHSKDSLVWVYFIPHEYVARKKPMPVGNWPLKR